MKISLDRLEELWEETCGDAVSFARMVEEETRKKIAEFYKEKSIGKSGIVFAEIGFVWGPIQITWVFEDSTGVVLGIGSTQKSSPGPPLHLTFGYDGSFVIEQNGKVKWEGFFMEGKSERKPVN